VGEGVGLQCAYILLARHVMMPTYSSSSTSSPIHLCCRGMLTFLLLIKFDQTYVFYKSACKLSMACGKQSRSNAAGPPASLKMCDYCIAFQHIFRSWLRNRRGNLHFMGYSGQLIRTILKHQSDMKKLRWGWGGWGWGLMHTERDTPATRRN
jgi:hypothetical protein